MRIVLLGPPGAGKGTQASLISERLAVPVISTGEIFRANVSGGTPLGKSAREFLDSGLLVPDRITDSMVGERLDHADARAGFLLDGYPRSVAQARSLDLRLRIRRARIDAAIELRIAFEEVIHRMSGRRHCPGCGRTYHVEYLQPAISGRCDTCDGELLSRSDDTAPVIANRVAVYSEQTEPVLEWYRSQGRLATVDASGAVGDVARRTTDVLDRVASPLPS